jgi:hypothetical protein
LLQLCLPDWPWWNRHPLNWLEAPEEEEEEEEVAATEKRKKKKEKSNKEKVKSS